VNCVSEFNEMWPLSSVTFCEVYRMDGVR
jgi:hypothetical protein